MEQWASQSVVGLQYNKGTVSSGTSEVDVKMGSCGICIFSNYFQFGIIVPEVK